MHEYHIGTVDVPKWEWCVPFRIEPERRKNVGSHIEVQVSHLN